MTITSDSIRQLQNAQSSRLPEMTLTPPPWYLEHSLWIGDPMLPGNAAHNYPLALRIRGPLSRSALVQSVQEIMRHHPVLRSVFRMVDGKPAQRLMPFEEIDVPHHDLTGLSEGVREAEATVALSEDARRPFDLTRGPMLRVLLVELQTEDHILLLTTHHVVCDYW